MTRGSGALVGLVVECPACWFQGGAPVGDAAAAVELADAHDRAAHGGTATAVIGPARETGSGGGAAAPVGAGAGLDGPR